MKYLYCKWAYFGIKENGTNEKKLVLFIKNYFDDEISLLYGDGHFEYLKEVFGHFSKKTRLLAARLGARNFTRALGYAKHPLSGVQAFADAGIHRQVRPFLQAR